MKHDAWPVTLVAYIKAMHDVDVIWKPEFEGQEPPF